MNNAHDCDHGAGNDLAERVLLGFVRMASLPLLVLVIVMASSIYAMASFIRLGSWIASFPRNLRSRRIARVLPGPFKAQDA